jgi:hypothetical protein
MFWTGLSDALIGLTLMSLAFQFAFFVWRQTPVVDPETERQRNT